MARTDLEQLQFQMAADIRTLTKQMAKAEKTVKDTATETQGHLDTHPLNYNRFVGDPSKAFNNVIRRSRLGVIEEAGAKIPIFGSALEDLGVAGVAAGLGLLAVAEGAEKVKQAMEFADEVDNSARRLHVTTDALQEYRFALGEVGGAEKGADEALEDFSSTLGKAQAGLPRAMRAFKELGFTPEQVKSFGNVEDALQAVIEKIAGLKSDVQKDAVIDQMGLKSMKPLIEAGIEKMRELRQEAKDMGIVMDEGMVRRGAQLNKQFEALAKVIDVQLKEAIIDIAPLLIGIMKQVAEFAAELNDTLQSFKALKDESTHSLQRQAGAAFDDKRRAQSQLAGSQGNDPVAIVSRMLAQSAIDRDSAEIARIAAELRGRTSSTKPSIPHGTGELVDQTKPKASGAADALTGAGKMQDDAEKRLAEAKAALAGDVELHAQLEKQAVAAERDKQQKEVAAKAQAAAADATIEPADKKLVYLKLILTSFADDAVAAAKDAKIDRDKLAAIAERSLKQAEALGGYSESEMAARASLARTAAERASIELQALKDRQNLERRSLQVGLDKQVASGEISPADRDEQLAGQSRSQKAVMQAAYQSHLGPLDAWRNQMVSDAADVQTAMENVEVKGIDGLNDAFARSIAEGQNWKQSLSSLIKGLEVDLIKLGEQQLEAGIFGSPQIGPRKAAAAPIIDPTLGGNPAALGGANLLGSLANITAGAFAPTPPIQQDFHLHAENAVMTEDLLTQMVGQANSSAATAAAGAIDFTKRNIGSWMSQLALEAG